MEKDAVKIVTEQKDKQINEFKKEVELLNGALMRANKKLVALQHEIEELQRTGDIKKSLKEYEEIDRR